MEKLTISHAIQQAGMGMAGAKAPLTESELKAQIEGDRKRKRTVSAFTLDKCIGKITVNPKINSEIAGIIMNSKAHPHTLLIKS